MKWSPGCDCCGGGGCCGVDSITSVSISGLSSPDCTGCSKANGTYAFRSVGDPFAVGFNDSCTFSQILPQTTHYNCLNDGDGVTTYIGRAFCLGLQFTHRFSVVFQCVGGQTKVTVTLALYYDDNTADTLLVGGGYHSVFSKTASSGTLAGVLPFVSGSPFGTCADGGVGDYCGANSATVAIL